MNRESCEGRQSDLPPIIAITTLSILAVQGCREVGHLTLVVHWNAAGNKAQSELHLKRCSVVVNDLELLGHLAACRDGGGGGRLQADLHCLGNGSLTGETTLQRYVPPPHLHTLTWNMKSWMGELVRLLASRRMLVVVGEGEGKVNITFSPCFSYAVRAGTSWVAAGAAV